MDEGEIQAKEGLGAIAYSLSQKPIHKDDIIPIKRLHQATHQLSLSLKKGLKPANNDKALTLIDQALAKLDEMESQLGAKDDKKEASDHG